jgi:hypothetical protein
MSHESYALSEKNRYTLTIVNRLGIGFIIIIWGSLLALRTIGIIDSNVSTWPFAFTAFGILLVFGGIFRYHFRNRSIGTEN